MNILQYNFNDFIFVKGRVLSLAWHKNEEFIVTGSIDYVTLWSCGKGQVIIFLRFFIYIMNL